jgi:hypothetical protein
MFEAPNQGFGFGSLSIMFLKNLLINIPYIKGGIKK